MAAVGHQPQLQPAKQNSRQKQPVTQLEFHQAMADFKVMFPEMDEDVIEVVLRANNGAVDATIDQLLSMSTDNENEKLRAELDATENDELPPSYSPATPPPSYHQAVPYAHSPGRLATVQLGRKTSASPSLIRHAQYHNQKLSPSPHQQQLPLVVPKLVPSQKSEDNEKKSETESPQRRKWNPPLVGPLPSSFLRLEDQTHTHRKGKYVTVLSTAMIQKRIQENESRRNTIGSSDPEVAQYLEDERVALFLQNEEFVRELMANQDFLTTLEKDSRPDELPTFQAGQPNASKECEKNATANIPKLEGHSDLPVVLTPDENDAAFRERLKNMGKMSRRKFAQLASIFSRRKRAFKPMLGEGSNPSRDNLLLHEDEYSELSEDDSDTDWNKKDSWNSHHGDLGERSSTMKNHHKSDHS
uniref:CUE domain-containing protein 1 n=1 Tax=Parasteatoda tepidariorum TaxID=114398 RepID=A0A2L2YLU2_PARTP